MGVSQNRERIYIVGFNKDKVNNYKDFSFPVPPCLDVSVGNILEQNVDAKYTISNTLWQGHQRRKKEHKIKGNGFDYTRQCHRQQLNALVVIAELVLDILLGNIIDIANKEKDNQAKDMNSELPNTTCK